MSDSEYKDTESEISLHEQEEDPDFDPERQDRGSDSDRDEHEAPPLPKRLKVVQELPGPNSSFDSQIATVINMVSKAMKTQRFVATELGFLQRNSNEVLEAALRQSWVADRLPDEHLYFGKKAVMVVYQTTGKMM
jgi:hypothetical protein